MTLEDRVFMTLEDRVFQLEKEMADLKRQLGERPEKFIPEDSENGKQDSFTEKLMKNPYSKTTQKSSL